jgi:hypothetical protein
MKVEIIARGRNRFWIYGPPYTVAIWCKCDLGPHWHDLGRTPNWAGVDELIETALAAGGGT